MFTPYSIGQVLKNRGRRAGGTDTAASTVTALIGAVLRQLNPLFRNAHAPSRRCCSHAAARHRNACAMPFHATATCRRYSFIARRSRSSFGSISDDRDAGDQRVDGARNHVLPDHDGDPARVREELALVAQEPPAFGEQCEPALQRLRDDSCFCNGARTARRARWRNSEERAGRAPARNPSASSGCIHRARPAAAKHRETAR